MSNNISFKAEFIRPSVIKRCYQNKPAKDLTASFVELKPGDYADREALREISSLWGEGETFASSILYDFEDSVFWREINKKYYALTLQKQKLEQPNAKKILGVAQIIQGINRIKLNYLQADPQNNMHSANPKYRGIGTSILDALKAIFPNFDIVLNTAESAREFYKANGFKELSKTLDEMIFRHSKEADLPK